MATPSPAPISKRPRDPDSEYNHESSQDYVNIRPQQDSSTIGRNFNPADYPRKRVLMACEVCRLRKTRCDAARPRCSFCKNLDLECVYRKANNAPQKRDATFELPDSPAELQSLIERAQVAVRDLTRSMSTDKPSPLASNIEIDSHLSPASISQVSSFRRFSGGSGPTPVSWDSPFPDPWEESDDYPCIVGANLHGFGRVLGRQCPPELTSLCFEDGETFLERELAYDTIFFTTNAVPGLSGLDLSFRTCWRNQQSFVRNILSWYPIFDEQFCTDVVKHATDSGFERSKSSTCLAYYILALGAFTRAEDTLTLGSMADTPGLDYFQAGCQCLDNLTRESCTITGVQCYILKSFYLLLCLRHLAAFDAIHRSSIIIARLLVLKTRLANDQPFRESCHRAYWICYMIENELRICVNVGTQLLEPFHEHIPLHLLHHTEADMFWFLSEIALRRIFVNGLCTVGLGGRTIYAPRVSEELTAQLEQWYAHLHPNVKFPLGTEPLLDVQRAFLRSQFYAALVQVYWPYVLEYLTNQLKTRDELERSSLLKNVEQAIRYAVLHLNTVECLLQDRFLMIFTTHTSAFAFSMLLLCISDVDEFRPLHEMETTIDTIQRVRRLMDPWAKLDLTIAANMQRLDDLMHLKGIRIKAT